MQIKDNDQIVEVSNLTTEELWEMTALLPPNYLVEMMFSTVYVLHPNLLNLNYPNYDYYDNCCVARFIHCSRHHWCRISS